MVGAGTCLVPPCSVQSACSSGNARALRLGRVLLMIGGLYCCALSLLAQTSDSIMTDQRNNSTDLKSDDLGAQRIPVRIIESHSQNGNRTIDERSIQIQGAEGRLEPYQEIETETLQVDANTVRTITRTFARDVNGRKMPETVML
jgi:hypothetical protein